MRRSKGRHTKIDLQIVVEGTQLDAAESRLSWFGLGSSPNRPSLFSPRIRKLAARRWRWAPQPAGHRREKRIQRNLSTPDESIPFATGDHIRRIRRRPGLQTDQSIPGLTRCWARLPG